MENSPISENRELIEKFKESKAKQEKILKERMRIEAALNQAKKNMLQLEEEAKLTEAGSVKNIPEFLKKAVPENEKLMSQFIADVESGEKILQERGIDISE